jgi:homoserine O-succinyltransferase
VLDHPLTQDLPARFALPHARWNEVGEADLAAHGYEILTRSQSAGVDAFVRQDQSLFLFFQGHPEYDARALLNEFRRDVGRFLRGEREQYPGMPQHYFDAPTEAALAAFGARACADPHEKLLADFPVPSPAVSNGAAVSPWYPFAAGIYRNWLTHLSVQKQRLQGPTRYLASLRLDKTPAPAV